MIRTIAPEDAGRRVPARYLPSMAGADERRMPRLAHLERWLRSAGFADLDRVRCDRNARLDAEAEVQALRVEVAARYPMVGAAELERGIARLREDARRAGGDWIDPRPTTFVTAVREAAPSA